MTFVIDTNILISALIRDSTTRRILLKSNLTFYYPEISLEELAKHEQLILEKSEMTKIEYNMVLLSLLNKITIVPHEYSNYYLNLANELMNHIDSNDVIFIATALATNSAIWSDDKHFKQQSKIKILTTENMSKL